MKFYEDVFGWDTEVLSDTPDFRYTTLGAGDDAKAGILDAAGYLHAEVPASWHVYFAVADTDAAIEKAVAMGADVVDGPDDTPFGRLATLTDPTGAMFKIVAGPPRKVAGPRRKACERRAKPQEKLREDFGKSFRKNAAGIPASRLEGDYWPVFFLPCPPPAPGRPTWRWPEAASTP